MTDTHGRRFLFLGSQVVAVAASLAVGAHIYGVCSLWPFLVLNTLAGLQVPAYLAVVADEHEPEQRPAAFARFGATYQVALLVVPLLSAKLALRLGFILSTAAGVLALALSCFYGETLPPQQRLMRAVDSRPALRRQVSVSVLNSSPLFRRLSVILVASSMVFMGSNQIYILFMETAYVLTFSEIAAYISLSAASGLIVQIVVFPLLLRRKSAAWILCFGLVLQLASGALILCPNPASLAMSCVAGGFGGVVFPCVASLKANAASPSQQGRIQGAISALQGFAQGVAPAVYGAAFSFFLKPHAFMGPMPQAVWGITIVLLLGALAAAWGIGRHIPENACCVDQETALDAQEPAGGTLVDG